jgi:hypothetical protein
VPRRSRPAALPRSRALRRSSSGAPSPSRATTRRPSTPPSRNFAATSRRCRPRSTSTGATRSRAKTISRLQNSEKSLQSTISKLQASEKSLQGTLEKLRADQSALQSSLDKTRADEKARQSTIERLQASEKSLQSTLDKLQGSEKSTQTTIGKLQASEKVYQAKLAQASAASNLAEAELKKVQGERDDLAEQLQRAENDLAEQSRSAKSQPQKGGAAMPIDQLRGAFQQFTAAGSVTDVLTVLVDALAAEFSRVALFNVNGNRLEGRRQTGFDFGSDISKVAVPLSKGSALAEAVRSGRVQGVTANELTDGNRKLFGGSPSFVLILPVPVANEVHAVIYADNSGQPKAEVSVTKRGVHFAEILLWHAIRSSAASPPRNRRSASSGVSTQLLGDLENVYNGDVSAGHKGEKLQRRLQHNVAYARNMFGQRAQDEGLDGVELFDVQLARLITAKQGVQFGKDLAAAARAANSGDQKAEAS